MSDKLITVTARLNGHYGGAFRKPGDVFTISDANHFSTRWMVKGAQAGQTGTSGQQAAKVRERIRSERIMSEGASAALEIALQDVKERDALIAELQARLAALEPSAPAEPVKAPDEVVDADENDATEAPDEPDKPVSRRRITREG